MRPQGWPHARSIPCAGPAYPPRLLCRLFARSRRAPRRICLSRPVIRLRRLMLPSNEEIASALAAAVERAERFLADVESRRPAIPFESKAPVGLSEDGVGAAS